MSLTSSPALCPYTGNADNHLDCPLRHAGDSDVSCNPSADELTHAHPRTPPQSHGGLPCPPAPKRARVATSRTYCCTAFKCGADMANPIRFEQWFSSIEPHLRGLAFLAGQIEKCKETGKLHFQFLVKFTSPVSFQEAKRRLAPSFDEGVHVEAMRGTFDEAYRYVTKPDTHVAGPYFMGKKRAPVLVYVFDD